MKESTKEAVKTTLTTAQKFGFGGAGFGGGLLLMKVLNNIALPNDEKGLVLWFKKLAPSAIIMLTSYFLSKKASSADKRLEAALLGVGFAGGADMLRKTLGEFIPWFKDNLPGINGLGITGGAEAINVGDFQMPYYRENAFQGMSMQGFSMQGAGGSPYALNGDNAYALNGADGGYALMGRRRRGLRGASEAYALN
jgi:hypothetical protein